MMMQADLAWLENPEVFRVNRLDAHADHCFYENEQTLASQAQTLRQTLNGQWRFAWSPAPAQRPAAFYKEDYNLSAFGSIAVPGHIELQGYGQIQYVNTMYPWDGRAYLRPPEVDESDNPVGSYVKEFDLDAPLQGKRVCVSFAGVEQAFYVWCNGQFVGYSEDSFTPADFDLTPYVRAQNNRLCVEVYKRSSAAWIEDQDFFRFSGIFREVYLYAKPAVHVEDVWLQAGLLGSTTGTLSIELKLSRAENGKSIPVAAQEMSPQGGLTVHCHVADAQGTVLYNAPLALVQQENKTSQSIALATPTPLQFPNIQPWQHESPILYTVTLSVFEGAVQTGAHKLHELVPYCIGFRRVEISNGVILLNGKRLVLHGVNRHEWSPSHGRAISAADMCADMEAVRRNHINAVRTSHYPNQSLWYDLCDANGIYVMDEANLESHGSWQKMGVCEPSWNVPGDNPAWQACVLDRAQSMLERDKNHASVLFWSCGNEAYAGTCIAAMAAYFREKDPTRIVHYEGVHWNRKFAYSSDVESRMYATPQEIRAYLQNAPEKPFMLCEFMHNMGNSLGGMESYMQLLEEFPQYQGGFIWDFKDQALWYTDGYGRRVLGYGGDFGERPTDYSFSANGLLFADGAEKPAMQEVRYWYASPAHRARHNAENARGQAAAQHTLDARTKATAQSLQSAPPLSVIEGDVHLGVRGAGFEVLFSYVEGGPVSLRYAGVEWLHRAPKPAFWRATTENDKGNGFSQASSPWMGADLWARCTEATVQEKTEDRVAVQYTYEALGAQGARVVLLYTVNRLGALQVRAQYYGREGLPQLPAFGVRFFTAQPCAETRWLGLSGETYPDRYKGGIFGMHAAPPHVPAYLVPQECGCHVNTHEAALCMQNGQGRQTATLTVTAGDTPFAFSALPCTPHALETAQHRHELPQLCHTVMTVYAAMRGVGGIDSWGANVEPVYALSAQNDYEVSFTLHSGT